MTEGVEWVESGPNQLAEGLPGLKWMRQIVDSAYTGGQMKRLVEAAGFEWPRELTAMYLSGEGADYLAAAVLATTQRGA